MTLPNTPRSTKFSPRKPIDDEERSAFGLERHLVACMDSLPPDHDECQRACGHYGDHVATQRGLVIGRWNDSEWIAAYDAIERRAEVEP